MEKTVKMHCGVKTNPEGNYTNLIIDAECEDKKYHSVITFSNKNADTDGLAQAIIGQIYKIADQVRG